MKRDEIVLTGDRPTGSLHLGHFVGSLQNRVMLQEKYRQFIMIADVQALTDNYERAPQVAANVHNVVLDYLAVGIDPQKSTIFIQSQIAPLFELTVYFLNFASLNRVLRNPTVKTEIELRGFGESVPSGFAMYPVSQAADIAGFRTTLVPVGNDQLPMIEQTNEIVRAFNRHYGPILQEVEPLLSPVSRLVGTDGKQKMSKSTGNAIFLSDSADEITKKVMSMYTDPTHLRVADPGKVEGNTVFTYLDIFDPNKDEIAALKEHYQRGGLGDMVLKRRLNDILQAFLKPIRERREDFAQQPDFVQQVLQEGRTKALNQAETVVQDVKNAMGFLYR